MRRFIVIIVLFLIILALGVSVMGQPATAVATLVLFEGQAHIVQAQSRPGIGAPQTAVTLSAGETLTLNQGDHIAIPAGATAQLRFYDGSAVDLHAGAELLLSELDITSTNYRVQLQLFTGKTVSRVTKLLGVQDSFRLRTPSSTAAVRGTVFTVEVLSDQATFVAVDEGIVQIEMAEQMIDVHAGQMLTAVLGQPLQVQPQNGVPAEPLPVPDSASSGQATAVNSLNTATVVPQTIDTPASQTTATRQTPPTSTAVPTTAGFATAPVSGSQPVSATNTPPAPGVPAATPASTPGGIPATGAPTAIAAPLTPTKTPPTQPTAVIPPTATLPPATATRVKPTATTPPSATPPPTATPGRTTAPPSATPLPTATALPTSTPAPTSTPPPTATSIPSATTAPTATNTSEPPTATPELVTLCHHPPGNPNQPQTIQVLPGDVQAHLDHGDYLGPCQ